MLEEVIMNHSVFNLFPRVTMKPFRLKKTIAHQGTAKNLSQAKVNKEYVIDAVISDDENIVHFLFTLGCFKGEPITVISVLCENYIVAIKDARYSLDIDLAKSIALI